jgi:hypothetical protein
MNDFWLSCGHHLLDRDADGRLRVTDAFLKAYLARPELLPPETACAAERRLHHELLMHQPRRLVEAAEIAGIEDPDARENWELMIAFRDRILAAPSLEAAYLCLVRGDVGNTPPLFLNQLAQLVLRNALDGSQDPFELRAAELFFRPQRVTFHEGTVLMADAETVEVHERSRHVSPLLAMLGGPAVTELDIIDECNAPAYFERSDAFDMVLNFGTGTARRGLAAAMSAWLRHLLGIEVQIEPAECIEDDGFAWFVGLDAEATRIGNALWRGLHLDATDQESILALYRLGFRDFREAPPAIGARPVWLILAMTPDGIVRMKPQNLAAGLPFPATAT